MNIFTSFSMRPRMRAAVLCRAFAAVLAAGAPAAGAAPASQDVLDTPARQSALALKGALSGIAVQSKLALAAGVRGTILVSQDAGRSWKQVAVPVAADLSTVRFTGPQPGTAWAVGHDGVLLRSADSGQTWTRVLDGRSLLTLMTRHYRALADAGDAEAAKVLAEVTRAAEQSATPGVLPYPFLDIRIGADGEGFAAGAFGFLLHTMDAGKTWEPWIERAENDRRMHLYALAQAADGTFYLAGEQGLLRRYDRTAHRFVTLQTPYAGTFFGLVASEAGLVAFGLRGNAFISTDNARSWKQVPLGGAATVVDAVECAPGQLAFVTQSGQVLLSRDGGASVLDAQLPRAAEVFGAALAAPGQLALAGVGGARVAALPHCGADHASIGKN